MANIWNKQSIITPVQEYQLVYQYTQHRNQVQTIREKQLSVEKPFLKKKQKFSKSSKLMELKHPENQEQRALVQRIIEINHGPSEYTKEQQSINRPTNFGYKILEMRRLIEDNEGIEKRLKSTAPVIQFDKLKQEYKKNKSYLRNITQNSRRIYNCFVTKSSTPLPEQKKKKKKNKKQKNIEGLINLRPLDLQELPSIQVPPQTEKQESKREKKKLNPPINIKDEEIAIKSMTNIDEDKLLAELEKLKLKHH
ncbi:hypothetical protein pb186bvf_019367 [Paramecium bursaria]